MISNVPNLTTLEVHRWSLEKKRSLKLSVHRQTQTVESRHGQVDRDTDNFFQISQCSNGHKHRQPDTDNNFIQISQCSNGHKHGQPDTDNNFIQISQCSNGHKHGQPDTDNNFIQISQCSNGHPALADWSLLPPADKAGDQWHGGGKINIFLSNRTNRHTKLHGVSCHQVA